MGKNNYHLKNIKEGTKVESYSIKKFKVGAASVVIGASIFFGAGAVAQASESVSNNTATDESLGTEKKLEVAPKAQAKPVVENTRESVSAALASKLENSEKETLNKVALTKLIEEIDGKFTNGKYASKTEESVNQLKTALEEARTVLNNAETQAELSQAQAKLVTATTKLQTKPEDKKEAPKVDATNGQPTVGKKATNTEKAKESNSIANSGSRDERNGKALDKNNPFRTDAATTDTDPAAHQTYTAPAADANLETLSNELKNLPNMIENNKKIQNMDTLGNALKVEKGSVTEINEFGGWKAVGDSGKFAIARKTEAGVFPIETINTVWQAQSKTYQTWVLEQSFNRDSDYMLFLSKVRTKANSTEEAFDNSKYKPTDEGPKIAKGVKGFNGIQKTFKAYSKEHGSKVIVSFKTGYTGDIDGAKAQYKVEVIVNRNGHEEKLYDQTFKPEEARNNTEMTVVKASDGTNRPQNFITPGTTTPTKAELEAKIANNKPNGTGGTFTSKEITLPEGVTEYTVRISSADNQHLGMGYQSPYRHYALPVTGLDFNIDQDTGAIAKDLLSRIYEKLKATETADIDGKTNETKAAYLAELENIKTLVTSTDVKKTAEYKVALESILSKQLALKVDKTGLTESKTLLDGLVNEDPTPGKTKDTATAYNEKKQDAIKAIEAAKTVIDSESATVAQVREALATVNAKKEALQQAKDGLIEAATAEEKTKLKADAAKLTKADETGKTPNSIAAYEAEYEKLKAQLEEAKAAAAAVEAKGDNASKTAAQEAQAKVDAAKTALDKAAKLLVNKADKAELTTAKEALNTLATEADPTTGKTADSAKAYNDAKTAAQEAIKEAETVINNENATPEQVTAALEKVNAKKEALQQAKDGLIEAATAEEKTKLKADAAQLTKADETGKTPDSIAVYEAAYEKLKAQLEEAKAAAAAVEAKGDNASKDEVKAAQAKVDAAKAELTKAAELLKVLDRDAAKKEIADAAKKATDAIEASTSLTPEQKAEGKAKVAKEAKDATDTIDNATTQEGINSAKENGKLAIEKEAAKAEIDAALAEKEKAIEANNKLSEAEKQAAKGEAKKAADAAKKAIAEAKDQAGVDAKAAEGKAAIAAVNPVGKEKAKAEIDAALAEKEKAIEANNKLSDAEKRAAKAEAKKAADEAKKAIAEAKDQAGVDAKAAEGKAAIAAVNPVGKEKAQAEIDAALAEKEKAIEANNKLSDAEKQAAKAEAKKAADEAKKAIAEAKDQAGVDAKAAEGKAAIAAVNPVGKDKAKAEVEGELAKKLAELENSTDLTDAEKATAKARVLDEAKKAIEAIEKAMSQAEVDQVIRNFVYHTSAVVLEKEEYDLSKLLVNGPVTVKQGESLTDKDILSKLNLPNGVEIVKVEKPTTSALGTVAAKVTLKLADGTQVTITVPVVVVKGTATETTTTSTVTSSKEETTVKTSDVAKSDATEKSSNKVSNKQLPNTGTTETNTGLLGLGLGILGLLAAARRRKEK